MNEIEFKLNSIISEINDTDEEVFLIRLYDEYQKNKKISKQASEQINLLKIRSAYTKIMKEKENINVEENLFLKNKIDLLDFYVRNFEIGNKQKISNCVDSITKLECYLKLPITFPSNLENCLRQEIEKKRPVKKRVM